MPTPMRLPLIALAACLSIAAPAAALPPGLGSWDPIAQRVVQRAEVMAPLSDGHFHGERSLSPADLRAALAVVAPRLGAAPVAVPERPISVRGFHQVMVAQLGMSDVAGAVQAEAERAGLR